MVKLNKSASETFQTLAEVYGTESMSRARAFEWHERFRKDRTNIENNERSGRPSISKATENI